MLQSVYISNLGCFVCPLVILTSIELLISRTSHFPCHLGCSLPLVGLDNHTGALQQKNKHRNVLS